MHRVRQSRVLLLVVLFFRNAVAERVCNPGNFRRWALPAEASGPRQPRARRGADRGLGRREQLPEVHMHLYHNRAWAFVVFFFFLSYVLARGSRHASSLPEIRFRDRAESCRLARLGYVDNIHIASNTWCVCILVPPSLSHTHTLLTPRTAAGLFVLAARQGGAEQHHLEERAAGLSALAPGRWEGVGNARHGRWGIPLEQAAHPLLHNGPALSPG